MHLDVTQDHKLYLKRLSQKRLSEQTAVLAEVLLEVVLCLERENDNQRSNQMFQEYVRKGTTEAEPWTSETDMTGVSISDADRANGSPKPGDMIARNSKNHDDRWLIAAAYFEDNFTEAS